MVRSIRRVTGTGVPVRGDDIDTDQIVPARFLKEVTFDDMGEYAFYDARRDDDGSLNDHPFNEYRGARVLVVRDRDPDTEVADADENTADADSHPDADDPE